MMCMQKPRSILHCLLLSKTRRHKSNSLDAMIVEILWPELRSLCNNRKSTQDQNFTCVMHVTRPFFTHSLLDIKECTLERNMFSVMNVERPLANRQSWNDTAELLLQENNTFDNVSKLIALENLYWTNSIQIWWKML